MSFDYKKLIENILEIPNEREWFEFKTNNPLIEDLGKYISALSNSACLCNKKFAYLFWGISDNKEVVGTTFDPIKTKKGNQDLENWLQQMLRPTVNFRFDEVDYSGNKVVILTIPCAITEPVKFQNIAYIRVGSHNQKLMDYPDRERCMWNILSNRDFEDGIAADSLSYEEVLSLLDFAKYYEILEKPLPEQKKNFLDALISEKFVLKNDDLSYAVTNLGALLIAKNIKSFPSVARKSVRIIQYKEKDRTETISEIEIKKGYVLGFTEIINQIITILPRNEVIKNAIRQDVPLYPDIAIRELVANALVHQDLTISGTGPTVEIFSDRIEITSPGIPLIDPIRFIDEPPQTRNEKICTFMRRVGICEERGSGIDKVVKYVEMYQLPAPDFKTKTNHTVAYLYAPIPFKEMGREDRVRACYQHASLLYIANQKMTNTSLRERFGLSDKSYTTASKIISDTLQDKLIKPAEQNSASKRDIKYIPFWG